MGCSQSKSSTGAVVPPSGVDEPPDGALTSHSGSASPSSIPTVSAHSVGGSSSSAAPSRSAKDEDEQEASIPDDSSVSDAGYASDGSDWNDAASQNSGRSGGGLRRIPTNPKSLKHSESVQFLADMIESRRVEGDLQTNVVHIEDPFGKPIEEVYDGVRNGPVLGTGIAGLVRLVTHKATGVQYAVKTLDLSLIETEKGKRQLREEIYIMTQLDHPNIVRLEEVYESHTEIYLVQELCLGGELFDKLDDQPDYHYTEAQCAKLVRQMLCAVRYLHSKGIVHRDLKLENFLFSSDATDSELKMIDFGLSKHFKLGEVQHEAVGTPYTVAPEVIRGSYDERCDVWAMGVITYLLLSGDPPFGGCGGPESLMTVRSNILRGSFRFEPEDIWSHVSEPARDFIRTLLVTDPNRRPTAREAQKHPWLQEWTRRGREDASGTGEESTTLSVNVVEALTTFKEYSDMRKLLCEVLSFTLLPDQIRHLRTEFDKVDRDGSGEISLTEFKRVLTNNTNNATANVNLTDREIEDIFDAMRVRKSEPRVHWHEFVAAALSQCCRVDDRNLRLAFDRLDNDHKGYITFDDFMDVMGVDGVQREDAMRRMWGEGCATTKGGHSRCHRSRHITYDDFKLDLVSYCARPQ